MVSLSSAFLQVSILAIGFNIYRTMAVSLLMEKLLSAENIYPDFYFLAFWQILYDNMIAVSVFFAFMKVLALTPFLVLENSISKFIINIHFYLATNELQRWG